MKSQAQLAAWAHRAWAAVAVSVDEHRSVARAASGAYVRSDTLVDQQSTNSDFSRSASAVRILAICQALLFLAVFLFICARAGAITETSRSFKPELGRSVYSPQASRDPFGSEAAKSVEGHDGGRVQVAGLSVLKLSGILYDPVHPAAIVNNQLLELNKPVGVQTERGEFEVKALRITREVVLLDIGGQKVELRLSGGDRDKITQ